MRRAVSDTSLDDDRDPAFETALAEFQDRYSPQDILRGELS
jgi:hypothetical protein